ncbi:MAG TPA: hypothetical protein VGM12_01620 [Trebonia sp.]
MPGATRRGMLRGAAGIGVAGLAAGMIGEALASPAHAATLPAATAPAGSAAHDEPLVVHVHDARSGVVDLYTGTQHVRFTDHQLAARLAQAAR